LKVSGFNPSGRRLDICFLLGSPDISGGTSVIFHHAWYAMTGGHRVTIVTDEVVTQDRVFWHPRGGALTFRKYEEVNNRQFDLVIATYWKTALRMHEVSGEHYVYFVQSIESRFCSARDETLRDLIENTYLFDVHYVTEVAWIQDYLRLHFNRNVELVLNGIDHTIYRPEGVAVAPRPDGPFRVLIEGPLNVPMKNTERSIDLAKAAGADEIWLMTSSAVDSYPGVDRVFSRVPAAKTAEIYRSCDVLVKLSYVEGMFGPPLEMLLCGGTVVAYKVTGHELYLRDGQNCLLADIDDEVAVVLALSRLRANPVLRRSLMANAVASVADWPDWMASSARFLDVLIGFAAGRPRARQRDLACVSRQIDMTYVTAERMRLRIMETEGEAPIVNPSSRFNYPEGRSLNDLEVELRALRARYARLEAQIGPDADSGLQREIQRLQEVADAQEKLVLERWDAMQEMGRFIFERDQRIAALEAEARDRKAAGDGRAEDTPASQSALQRLNDVIAAQDRLILERWDAMQEMGRFIYERDQRIAALEAKLNEAPARD
jgi:O-antigen biosynthesis protein